MTLEREKIVPHLKVTGRTAWLYPCAGTVFSVKEVVEAFCHVLARNEQKIVEHNWVDTVPPFLEKPLFMSFEVKDSEGIPAERSGARSAYMKEKTMKLKGCRPKPGVEFPTWDLEFGVENAVTGKTGFGILSAENIMREILAFCFFEKYKIGILQNPLCVFEYAEGGYCLVLEKPKDERTEGNLNFFGLTIRDVIYIKFLEKKFGITVLEKDVTFEGIDQDWYAEQKSTILISMNFNGGFRGILNSNLGNDILYKDNLYICDFDTFKVVEIPENPSFEFLKYFSLWCFVELFKTSPPVWDYLDLEGIPREKAVKMLQKSFFENSSTGKCYKEQFFVEVEKRGWDKKLMEKALEAAAQTEVYYQILLDSVLNSEVLKKSYNPEMGIYALH